MATIAELIDDMRVELDDSGETRFSDATLLALVKQAIRRANRVIQRNQLHFAKKKASLTTTADQSYVDLPEDFDTMVPRSIWRSDNKTEVILLKENEWGSVPAGQGELSYARIDPENSRLEFKGTPSGEVNIDLYYFPTVSAASMTVGSTIPWSGKLDDAIMEYSVLRARNIDEQDVSVETQLIADLENQIILTYGGLQPTVVLPGGPYEGY